MLSLIVDKANLPPLDRFPDYIDPFTISEATMTADASPLPKQLARLQSDTESSRGPSPQPTHFSVPLKSHGNGHYRVLRSATVGYVAPEFQGKVEQMEAGKCSQPAVVLICLANDFYSQADYPELSLDSRDSH